MHENYFVKDIKKFSRTKTSYIQFYNEKKTNSSIDIQMQITIVKILDIKDTFTFEFGNHEFLKSSSIVLLRSNIFDEFLLT